MKKGERNAGGVWKSRIGMLEGCEEGGKECWRGVVWKSRIGMLEGFGEVG